MDGCRVGFILSLCLTALMTQSVHGIDCYICTSSADSGCGEVPDEAALMAAGKVTSGCYSCLKTFKGLGTLWSSVERSCGAVEDDSCTDILGNGKCSCTTTFCNGGTSTSGAMLLLLIPVSMALRYVLL